jgi:hypothetical protein
MGVQGSRARRGLSKLATMRDVVAVRAGTVGVQNRQRAYFLLSASSAQASLLRAQLEDLLAKKRLVTRRLTMIEQRILLMRRNLDIDRPPQDQVPQDQAQRVRLPREGRRGASGEARAARRDIEMRY